VNAGERWTALAIGLGQSPLLLVLPVFHVVIGDIPTWAQLIIKSSLFRNIQLSLWSSSGLLPRS